MLIPVIRANKKKKICTQPVAVKCIRIEYSPDGDESLKNPIWEGTVNGRTVEYGRKDVYLAGVTAEEGEERTFYVNPNNLGEYYDPVDKSSRNILFFIGGFLVFMGVAIIAFSFDPES